MVSFRKDFQRNINNKKSFKQKKKSKSQTKKIEKKLKNYWIIIKI